MGVGRDGHTAMTRAEETCRVVELRAAFAASDEPDVFRWFARRELAEASMEAVTSINATSAAIPHNGCKTYSECRREQVCFDPWHCSGNQQSAAEPPRDRTDFAWDVIGETESF